ncbi:acyl-CoA N-acyltransferase [Cystobasidium minutum MCA 4210]|uniref:acyl-CoA N-acyltransferase n=1 Tax=Cystobasidium minutum MCA 4210 TaxID=1397322 RepID=UPI0034CEDB6B|eukprot:jgi/Rhomi1/181150/fgenesh1_pg.6_\
MPEEYAYRNGRPGRNTALPVQDYHATTPPEEYDLDFNFPVKVLESNGVRLEPLIPSLHAPYLYSQLSSTGSITFRYFGAKLPTSYSEYLTHIETLFHSPPTSCAFVIYDKSYTKENDGKGRIAGSIAYLNANTAHQSIEIGFVCILPEFQRTHVTTHAAGLLMQYALNPTPEGLGLRRVEWIAHSLNTPSQNAALRLGYTHEGLLRYHWRLDPSKEGSCKIEGDDWPVRHNWIGSVTVHDWNEEGKREHLKKLMDREVVLK